MTIGSFDPSTSFFFIAGPCVVEGREMMMQVAQRLAEIREQLGANIILKASYRKANRTSGGSFTGLGDEEALAMIAEAGRAHQLPTLTDIHIPDEAAMAAEFVDVLQIPAFLCRQTELIEAAAATGKVVNIKKGQFAAPEDMIHAVEKGKNAGNGNIMLCERGTSFGYHNLVVDMRSLLIMRQAGVPIVYDATHSLQLPSASGTSGGQPEYTVPLARAAVAVGINGVFFETHPNPPAALSDATTQMPLHQAEDFIRDCLRVNEFVRSLG